MTPTLLYTCNTLIALAIRQAFFHRYMSDKQVYILLEEKICEELRKSTKTISFPYRMMWCQGLTLYSTQSLILFIPDHILSTK